MTKTIRQKNYFASIGNRHGNHGQNIGDLGDPTLVDMLVMGMSGLISTFHCVTTESFARSVEVTRKGKSKVASKTAKPFFVQFSEKHQTVSPFVWAGNKQTNRLQQLTVVPTSNLSLYFYGAGLDHRHEQILCLFGIQINRRICHWT